MTEVAQPANTRRPDHPPGRARAHVQSLEQKHQHAREALEHYRTSVKEQREQEQRRHEHQVQELQVALRQANEALTAKNHELVQLNRDNGQWLERHSRLERGAGAGPAWRGRSAEGTGRAAAHGYRAPGPADALGARCPDPRSRTDGVGQRSRRSNEGAGTSRTGRSRRTAG